MAKSKKQAPVPLDLSGQGPVSDQPMSLRVTGGKTPRQLTRNQKKFSQLLGEIERLRARQQRTTATWETFLQTFRERIHPEEQRQHDLRKAIIRQLDQHLQNPKGLGPRQRDALADLIKDQLAMALEHEPELSDADLLELIAYFDQRADDLVDAEDNDTTTQNELPPVMVQIIRDAGLDPDSFRADMTETEFKAELQRQLSENPDAVDFTAEDIFENPPPPPNPRQRKGKAAPDPQTQAKQAEESRKRTISVIYKQLAKVLHPDLETDPVKREQKHHLMQELTAAYRQGDLHTLLRLELAWVHREEGDLDRLTDEKLKIYIELLHEQADDLHREINSTAYSPRFSAVARFASPFTGEPDKVDLILSKLRPHTTSLQRLNNDLEGPQASTELRETIKAYIQEKKAVGRLRDFGF